MGLNALTAMAKFADEINQFFLSSALMYPDDPVYSPEALQEAMWRIPICDLEAASTFNDQRPMTRATAASEDCYQSVTTFIASYYANTVEGVADGPTQLSLTLSEHLGKLTAYMSGVATNNGRRPFLTPRGWVGLGPPAIEPGDQIVIFFGCRTPVVLRPSNDGKYLLLGDAYVHGVDGEYMQAVREERAFHLC